MTMYFGILQPQGSVCDLIWLGSYRPENDPDWADRYQAAGVLTTEGASVAEALERAFRDDQVDSSRGRRSLSIGDVLVSDSQSWMVAASGFVELPPLRGTFLARA